MLWKKKADQNEKPVPSGSALKKGAKSLKPSILTSCPGQNGRSIRDNLQTKYKKCGALCVQLIDSQYSAKLAVTLYKFG